MAITPSRYRSRVLTVFESAMSQLVKTTKLYDYNNAAATDYDDTLPLNSKTSITVPEDDPVDR
jgi:hypothetical protein